MGTSKAKAGLVSGHLLSVKEQESGSYQYLNFVVSVRPEITDKLASQRRTYQQEECDDKETGLVV
jgi:hypothetical protein